MVYEVGRRLTVTPPRSDKGDDSGSVARLPNTVTPLLLHI